MIIRGMDFLMSCDFVGEYHWRAYVKLNPQECYSVQKLFIYDSLDVFNHILDIKDPSKQIPPSAT